MQTAVDFSTQVSKIQSFLLSYGWVGSRIDFFRALAPFLADQLQADYICIDKLKGNLEAETVAVWYDGHFEDNYSYRLPDTPCGDVLNQGICTIPKSVRLLYPKDEFLQSMSAESYAGTLLRDAYGRVIGLIAMISRQPADDMGFIENVLQMVAIRASAELAHRRTIRAFEGLSLAAHAILTGQDETEMLRQVCKIVVDYCEYSMVWVGFVNDDACKSITPVAYGGFEEDYLKSLNLTWDDTPRGRGPSGTAARLGQTVICMNTTTDQNFEPWRINAIERGYYSNMAVPMIADGKVIGVISVYGPTPDYFWNEDIHLITTLSNDLATGIVSLRLRRERDKMLLDLHMNNELLEVTVRERTAILTDTNKRLREEINIRKRNEKLLKKTEQKYRTVADYAYEAESWLGTDGGFIYVSPSFERITGYPAEDFLRDSSLYYKIAHPGDLHAVERHFNHIIFPNDDVCNLQYRIITKSGEVKWIGHTCRPVYNEEGDWIGQRGSNRDITAEKKFEETLLQSQKQLRALTARLDEIAESERKTVARYIHDELGHLLTALKFDIDSIAGAGEKSISSLAAEFDSVNKMINSLINAVRKISSELRPEIIDHLGLVASLEWQIKEFRKRTRICTIYKFDELSYPFSSKETTVIYRILQEILTNVARHANAKHVRIFLIDKEDELILRVSDNGQGFVPELTGEASLGILGMKERAISIGGRLIIESSPGKGSHITFRLPLMNYPKQP